MIWWDTSYSRLFVREFNYQGCRFLSVAHIMCYRYAVLHGLRTFANAIRKWAKRLTAFPTLRFRTPDWQVQCRSVLRDICSHLCLADMAVKMVLLESGRGLSPCHVYLRGGITWHFSDWFRREHCEWHLDWNLRTPGRWKTDSAWLASTWTYTQGAQTYCSLIGHGTPAWCYIYRLNTCCGHSLFCRSECVPSRRCCGVLLPVYSCFWYWLLIIWYLLLWKFLIVSTLKAYIGLMIFISLHIPKALDLWLSPLSLILVNCDHILVMDLNLLYRDFLVDDRELPFYSILYHARCLRSMMKRGTCTALSQCTSTRTLTSLVTHCPRITGYQKQLTWPCLVRWLWPVHRRFHRPTWL